MKAKISQLLLACMFVALMSLPVNAVQPDASTVYAVAFTVHNLAYNNDPSKGLLNGQGRSYAASSPKATQVCVFCHTPHNAAPAAQLWNKAYPDGLESTYRLYTSSPTLSDTVRKNSKITANSPSLLCMSCHDGKTAINVLHNSSFSDFTNGSDVGIKIGGASNFTMGQTWIYFGGDYPLNMPDLGAARAADGTIHSGAKGDGENGTNFTDDHPIGFSYSDAVADNTLTTKLHTVADAKSKGIRFFSYPRGDATTCNNCLECSSCHDPHRYYGGGIQGEGRKYLSPTLSSTDAQRAFSPFLTVANVAVPTVPGSSASGLCLSCHIK